MCGGPIGTGSRAHGSNGTRQLVPHHACLDKRRRGKAVCANPVALRQDILDHKILGAIAEVLQPAILERAVEKALVKLSYARSHFASRRTQVERELGMFSGGSTGSSTPWRMARFPLTTSRATWVPRRLVRSRSRLS